MDGQGPSPAKRALPRTLGPWRLDSTQVAVPDAEATGARASVPRGHRLVGVGERPRGTTLPVYRDASSSRVAVATGKVFVRFAPGVRAESRRAELRRAGYEISAVAGYAPFAAWVRSVDGDVVPALARLDELRAIADVEHVEPELLSPRASKG